MLIVLDTADAEAFEAAVSRAAEALRQLGDDDHLDVRRAHAVGVPADPQRALDLFAGREPGRTAMPASLVLHLAAEDLDRITTDPAAVTVLGPHQSGPALLDVHHAWLPGTTLVVHPVLDVGRTDAVDVHDPPAWMAELVGFRDRHGVFPGCRRRSGGCDLDHIEPCLPREQGGPTSQTRPHNLAPLCRRPTAPRPTVPGAASAVTTVPTSGPHSRVVASRSLRRHPRRPRPPAPDRPRRSGTSACPGARSRPR